MRTRRNPAFVGMWLASAILAMLSVLALLGRPAIAADDGSAARQQVERQQTQPLNNAPVWREVRSEESHFTVDRAPEAGVLIQSGGNTWRALRNGPITLYGGALLLVVAGAILGFHQVKGPITLHDAPTGKQMLRFTHFERAVHWGTAITFVILAITGLLMLFGKHLIVPVFGHTALSWLLTAGKLLHNYVGPLFLAFTVLMIIGFARDNVWQSIDSLWIRKAGGLLTREHVPSGRFNFGEKTWFWIGVTLLGLVIAASGLVMDFPNFGQTRGTMQIANLIHATTGIIMILLAFGHIYMGTIGVKGAYDSMRTGYVDETWAKEHHEVWYNEVKAGKSGRP